MRDWQSVFALAKQDLWREGVVEIRCNLKLAIDSLRAQAPQFWNFDQKKMQELLQHNKGIQKIFNNYSDREIAYAIRLARL